jgi:hypothetical protein
MVIHTKEFPFKWDPLGHSLIFSLQNHIINKTNLPLAHHLLSTSLTVLLQKLLSALRRHQHIIKKGGEEGVIKIIPDFRTPGFLIN